MLTSVLEERVESFKELWHRKQQTICAAHPCGADCSYCMPDRSSLTRILALCDQHHDRSIHELAPMIQMILVDSFYSSEGGDAMSLHQIRPTIDKQMTLLLATLEECRKNGF
jgi:hypothetical protein